jgi:hypothetical protein
MEIVFGVMLLNETEWFKGLFQSHEINFSFLLNFSHIN